MQKLGDFRRCLRRRTARGLSVGYPVQVFQVKAEHGGNRPRGLREIDYPVERQRREELAREVLIVQRRQREGRAVGALDLSLRQHARITAIGICARRSEEWRYADALRALELRRDG